MTRTSSRHTRQLAIARAKTLPLTTSEIRHTYLKRPLILALNRFSASLPEIAATASMLDIGCGRGANVALLRFRGWNAYGAEIDPVQLQLARNSMRNLGLDPKIIFDIAPNGIINADSETFDFVYSDNVIEHVRNIDLFVDETSRVLRPRSAAFHLFPSRWKFLEPHTKQPFVHWLPKGRLQYLAAWFWLSIGIEAGWVKLTSLSKAERARAYADYLNEHTHYRSTFAIKRAFSRLFTEPDTQIVSEVLADFLPLAPFIHSSPIRRLLEGLCITFHTSAFYMHKRD